MTIITLLIILLIGVLSGFVGAIAGGGGLISIPFLLFLGIPPQITLATNKFGGMGLSLGALYKFIKEKKIVWRYAIALSIVGTAASFIGSRILLTIETDLLQKIIGILLLALVPTIFFKKDFGLEERVTSSNSKTLGYLFYFFLSILASFFGGMGALLMSVVIYFFGMTMITGNATELVSYTIFSVAAVIIFAAHHIIDYRAGIALFIGMLVGGYVGAHLAIKKGDAWVKYVFAVVIVVSAVKILFF
ncbi:MAG: sulfite exporter TauE/SafE family protein [Patescibacteria group bacterium]